MTSDAAKLDLDEPTGDVSVPANDAGQATTAGTLNPRVQVRELRRTTKAPARASKNAPARFILIAWGFQYVERMLDLTLPAALAPGNLPTLVKDFNCEVTIVTESKFFDYISGHRTIARVRKSCQVRLVSMDDILFPDMYGWTITLASFRGFEDLGEKMKSTFLLFTFTDFILADGSFANLAKRMKAGNRLIVAPSYRVLEQKVEPLLRSRFDFDNSTISVPHREMAEIILKNKHYCIEAKTINQRLYYMELFEQFYWQVDPYTMICRQAPFALVCMMPEKVLTGIDTFWDYGILEAACPETRICAMRDSDEFLMLELQDEDAQHDLVRVGWPSEEQIAKHFQFTTNDHRTLGQFTLYLHSRDIPPEAKDAEKRLAKFVDRIFHLAGRPTPASGHMYWQGQKTKYDAFCYSRELLENHVENDDTLRDFFSGGGSAHPHYEFKGLIQVLASRVFGVPPYVSRIHVMRPDLKKVMEFLNESIAGRRKTDALVVMTRSDEGYLGSRFFKSVNGNHMRCAASTVGAHTLPDEFFGNRLFDVCLCELDYHVGNPFRFDEMYQRIRPHIRKGGSIILFLPLGTVSLRSIDLLLYSRFSCPGIDTSEIWFAGSKLRKLVYAWKSQADDIRERQRHLGWLAKAFIAAATTPLILLDNLFGGSEPTQTYETCRTSLTMCIRVQ